MLTNNKARGTGFQPEPDAANPRPENLWGQVLEITPADGDHAADTARWDLVVRAGDPAAAERGGGLEPRHQPQRLVRLPGQLRPGPRRPALGRTDQGRLWSHGIRRRRRPLGAGNRGQRPRHRAHVLPRTGGRRDVRTALHAGRAHPVRRSAAPGRDGAEAYAGFERRSTFEDPATRWPDFQAGVPPRPSVVVITKDDGGEIGG
jgi:hypothetical protein